MCPAFAGGARPQALMKFADRVSIRLPQILLHVSQRDVPIPGATGWHHIVWSPFQYRIKGERDGFERAR
jgi:hypothetical protein